MAETPENQATASTAPATAPVNAASSGAPSQTQQNPETPTLDPALAGGLDGFEGLFKVLALLFAALFNPEALKNDGLASLLGFDGLDDMNHWREESGGSFSKAVKTAHWNRIDTKKVEQEYHNYAKLVDSKNPMLELLGQHESGGDYNRAFGRGTFRPSINGKPLTECTINEVLAWQKQYTDGGSKSSAAGKYQIIRKTLAGVKSEMGLTGDEKFDEKMQDRMALHLLNKRGLDDYIAGRITAEKLVHNVSQEWASMPDLDGRSHYAGDGLNASAKGVTPETVVAAAHLTRDRDRNGGIILADASPSNAPLQGSSSAPDAGKHFTQAAEGQTPPSPAARPTLAQEQESGIKINLEFNTKAEAPAANPLSVPAMPVAAARPQIQQPAASTLG